MTAPETRISAVVFDVGRVIVHWDLRHLFAKLIDNRERLDWFLANVVTEQWHFLHDAGRPVAEMVAQRKREFPDYADLIDAYENRFLETVPGPVDGTADLIRRLHARGVPLFGITNFGSDFWKQFRPTRPELDLLGDIVVSGDEKMVKPDAAIFDLAERRFATPAPSMLFVDDNADNVAAADRLGWQTHRFSDAVSLERDLIARGLLE